VLAIGYGFAQAHSPSNRLGPPSPYCRTSIKAPLSQVKVADKKRLFMAVISASIIWADGPRDCSRFFFSASGLTPCCSIGRRCLALEACDFKSKCSSLRPLRALFFPYPVFLHSRPVSSCTTVRVCRLSIMASAVSKPASSSQCFLFIPLAPPPSQLFLPDDQALCLMSLTEYVFFLVFLILRHFVV